ncbi:f6d849f0-5d2a-406a-9775-7b47ea01da8c [Thermothielavioides terrestris]|uniref:F6d849f0-5d2a-406a-9775-7b47ea01da8c n=1 Tax=Thermothielavioides terrestris TaxID=2587410 RepID=A0A446BLX7_9PEZI|nr:f6d849f0-5d2a-406a-9775-7b47ea01da8c [Thermothielavioides terrestris]
MGSIMQSAAPGTDGALSIVNHPATRLQGPGLLHMLVQHNPQAKLPAIDFLAPGGDRVQLSYTELHRASEALALRISALAGLQEDSGPFVVPVLVPQGPGLYIALLAILKAGGAFCPMNLDVPLERAKFILDDVSAKVVITTSEFAARLPADGRSLLIIDSEPLEEPPATAAKLREPKPTDLAYVMYTSGSTGTPKGVGISHDAATQSLLAHDRHIPPFSRFLQFAAPTFDVSVFEIFFTLFRGRTLVSCARSAMLNDLPAVIRQMEVDACELTPSVAGSLLRKRGNAPGLRLLLTIGEMLTQPVIEEFGGGGDDERPSMLWGMYGPTEAAIHCTLQPAFARNSPVGNIGIPLDTVSAFILAIPADGDAGRELKVLPRGEVGELAVGGYQLADGYLNRPEQTGAAFIDSPYGRLYRTGDKARMLPDGTLECLGRIADGQVKLRGQRMELGEVEHAALRTEGCHSAVAAVTEATLVLFCAVDGAGAGDIPASIMDSCRRWLPGFMLPGDIVVVEEFPRLASGKIDRKRLVAEYRARGPGLPQTVSYKDDLEQRLCELSSKCLGVTVNPHQELSSCGLDSLSAIKLASALRDAGFPVGVIELLEARTISGLHSRLHSATVTRVLEPIHQLADSLDFDVSDIVASHPALSEYAQRIESVIPCTPLQASMLAETMAEPQAYCNWVELRFTGSHTTESIRRCFEQLAKANEILRSGFVHHKGQFLQVIFEAFAESNCSTTRCRVNEFKMQDDSDFLRPFRVLVDPVAEASGTTVVVQLHHAVYDGWSLDLMLLDLGQLIRGEEPPHRAQFREVAAYYSSVAFRDSCDAAREFWAGNLLGYQPAALPVLNPQVTQSSVVLSTTAPMKINPRAVKATLQQIDCGPQTVFQAALVWLWAAMLGSQDVVVGSVQSGRSLPISHIEGILGPCIAAVPLRTDLSQMRTIKDLLLSVHAGNRAALSASVLPLSEIKRSAGIRPAQAVYDVLFVYQESLYSRDQSNNTVRPVAQRDYLETKLLVEVEPREEDFRCRFTFHANVFPESVVQTMADSIEPLVRYILDNLNSELGSMLGAFPQQFLSIFNPHPTTFSGVSDLARAVEQVAAASPDKDAVCFADRISDDTTTTTTITFAELNSTADRIGWHLGQLGVREGEVVAIIMEKSVRLYTSILATLKAGAAYLPLLPSTPVARIETILRHAEVRFCLVDTAAKETLEERVGCIFIDVQQLDIHALPALSIKPKPNPDRLAYIIYTSGSTGVPKGVCVTQRNMMSNLDVLSRIYPVKHDSRLLQSCSQAFDVSVFEIFFAWSQGMCLCSATNDTLFEDLERVIRKLGVTHLSMTPTVASLVDPAKVPRVEFLVTAGEAMTEAVARKWAGKLYQGYGPSETTNICSVKKMGAGQAIQHLGWTFDNTSAFVLERDGMQPVPFGCLGELCFGGDQVAQGYLNMEELTAAKFIHHPTLGRIYRSGDLGRMLPDGSLIFAGRVDEQVKIRGQRVELSEITEAIRQSEHAIDCASLFLHRDELSQGQIISFLVPKQRQSAEFRVLDLDEELINDVRTLYRALDSQLPAYMIPSTIVPISSLPMTASGKLDRARLTQVFRQLENDSLAILSHGAELSTDDGEWSPVETQIAEAVSRALHVSQKDVQRWTPLTALGLDSISAIELARQLHMGLGRRFPISLILQNPSIAKLARMIPNAGISEPGKFQAVTDLLPKTLVEKLRQRLEMLETPFTSILPCTPLQEAMLATSSGKGRYLNRMLFRVNQDLERLKQAWNAMCARHDILRTCFVTSDDAAWPILQVVLAQWQPVWHELDAASSRIEECISRHAQGVPEALDSLEPAISFAVITAHEAVYLSFVCHHALYDGVAIERLLFEVEQHVNGFSLPPPPPYEQFLLQSLDLPASTDQFWSQHLAGYEPKLVTNLHSDLAEAASRASSSELGIPLSQIRTRLKELGVSLLGLCQSAWATALGRLFQTDDVCFGSVVNGRSVPVAGIDQLVAPCFNTIPIRMDLSGSRRNLDLMKAFQSLNVELMAYQFTPLRRIQQRGGQRYFDTLLLLQQSPRALDQSLWSLEKDDGEMDPEQIRRHTTMYQLGLDSISAVRIASMLREVGLRVAASDVIEHPTCEKLARLIDTGSHRLRAKVAYDVAKFQAQVLSQVLAQGINLEAVEAVIPCTPLQSSMMAQFIRSGGHDYFNHIDFELADGISAAALEDAWKAVVVAHPMLRTAVVPVEHGDCAFALVQYQPAMLSPRLAIIPEEMGGTFDLEAWRAQACRAAAETPHTGLWSVVIVHGERQLTMHLAIHHAIYDAQSLQVVLDDLSKAAAGLTLSPAPPTENVVGDILGQVSAATESSAEFWKKHAEGVVINGFPVMTSLRQPSRSILAESATSSISLADLERAASNAGYSVQVVLQAAWTRVLSAYLGEDTVVFGVVLSGRNTETTRNAVFPCITTLPVISANNDSNHILLTQMLEYNAGLFSQQHQSLTRIQRWLKCPDAKLFDTLLVYQKLDHSTSVNRPWRVTHENASAEYPVSVEVEPGSDGQLGYRITFFNDVLDKEQGLLLLQQFDAAVQHLALEPRGRESGLFTSRPDLFSVLPPETPEIPTTTKFLHQFVEVQAHKTPHAIALHFVSGFEGEAPVGRMWTYKELNESGNRVARILQPLVETGAVVAVYFDKCPEAYFCILGILKAGCAFVALDPGAPKSRNEFILQDSNASVLVTTKAKEDSLPFSVSVPVVGVDATLLEACDADAPTLTRPLEPVDVCYCLYTSGTTGTPKGCQITHDNAVQCMLAFQHIFAGHWSADSKWLQFASLHFDVSVLEQYWSWSVGITLVAAPRDLILEDLAGTISRLDITHIDLTPSLARLLHPDDVPSLCRGVFITGGESLKQEILDAWGSKRVIYNFYGPTEATIGVTVYPRVPTTGRASNIGRQFINVGSYVLKPGTEEPVLRGGVGELCVSGRLVGKGYLKRDGLTSEKFPTLARFGERVYRTGDLVRVLHDGCFDFLGRADDQVKLRGQRLEIGEINHAIRKGVASVKDVATLVVRNEAQQKDFLVSFIVADGKRTRPEKGDRLQLVEGPEAEELCKCARDACRSKLPGYMVPTYVLQLPFIPLSANNKAELKELRRFFLSLGQDKLVSLSAAVGKSDGILDAIEMKVSEVAARMQAIDARSITAESNIFELGIDSVSVLRFSRALKKEGFAQASPSLILRHPLIRDLARALKEQRVVSKPDLVAAARQYVQACAHKHRSHVCRELGITPAEVEYIAPCSPLQQGMISRSATENAYFNTFRLILDPGVSPERLRAAFQRAVDGLPILRTKFVSTTDGFVQVALRKLAVPWSETSLDTETGAEEVVQTTKTAWIARNRGVVVGQPWEVVLMNGKEERTLVLHIFHGLYDANSFALLLDRIAAEYTAMDGGSRENIVSPPAPSFLEALCHGPLQDFRSAASFWADHLAGTTPFQPVPTHSTNTSAAVSRRTLPFESLDKLRASLAVTHQALVQAAWVSVLARQHAADPTIGIIVSGRNIELDGAERVYSTAVLAFQHVPLRDVQRWCSGGKPLFDTLFSFQREEQSVTQHRGLWRVVESEPNADYPLALEATLDSGGSLHLLLVARQERYGPNELSSMMDQVEHALGAMAENPGNAIACSQKRTSPEEMDRHAIAESHNTTGFPETRHLSVNGHPEPGFTWTEEALAIRSEMAALAAVNPESVTETTPLFGLGLDSIDIIKLAARLRKRGIEIKPSELMQGQTVQDIVQHLDARGSNIGSLDKRGRPRASAISEVTSALRQHVVGRVELAETAIVLPATPLQESMITEMIESDFQRYFNHDILELAPTVDLHKLKDAWKTVIAGSPILRTRFLPVEDPSLEACYCQVIEDEPAVHMSDVLLDSREELEKVCEEAILRAQKGAGESNLLQLAFVSVGSDRFLVLSIAHALYDGWSLGLIHQAVQEAYEGRFQPPSMESYLRQVEDKLFPEAPDASAFWSGYLQGAVPTVFPEHEVDSREKRATYRAELTSSLPTPEIVSFCKTNAVTLQTLGQACWAAALAAGHGSLDVTFGVVLSCRDTEEMEKLVFPTMNTVPVRSVLHGTISSWLRYMQDNATGLLPYQNFPLREALKLARANGPLFNTLFVQQRTFSSSFQHGRENWMKSVGGSSAVEYPMCVEMEMTENGLVWRIALGVSQDAATRILKQLDQLLAYFMRFPAAEVVEFWGKWVSICGQPPEVIRDVLGEVSGVPAATIRRSNNIYHLGLDSISAIKVGSLLRKKGIAVRVRDMLKAGSITDIARLITDAQLRPSPTETAIDGIEGTRGSEVPEGLDLATMLRQRGIDLSAVEKVLPASPMQVHMLSVWQNTQGKVFCPSFCYRLSSQCDIHTIDRAWKALVAETPILRTIFLSTNSRPTPILQVILRPSTLSPGHSSPDGATWHSRTTDNWSQPYNTLRAEKDGDGTWKLRLHIHHALYDAVSLPAIMHRFAALCATHPAETSSTSAVSNWHDALSTRWAADHHRAARKQFWTEHLAGAESWFPMLGSQHAPPDEPPSRVSHVAHAALQGIPDLAARCKANGVSLQALFFAAYADFLANAAVESGRPRPQRVVFGVYLANRAGLELDEPAGAGAAADYYPSLRLVPLRVEVPGGSRDSAGSLFDVAAAIQQDLHAISSPVNVEVGLWEVKDWTGITVDSFVNFLGVSGADPRYSMQGDVRLEWVGEPTEDDAELSATPGREGDAFEEGHAREIASNPVRGAFPDAVDVEVSVEGEAMTIGVFGSSQRLGSDGAIWVIDQIVKALNAVA